MSDRMERQINKDTFVETVRFVTEIVKTSNKKLTQAEIAEYFKGLNLSEAQQGMVYEYFQQQNNAHDLEEQNTSAVLKQQEKVNIGQEAKQEHSLFFQMYLKDLREINPCMPKEEDMLYEQLIAGDQTALQKLSDQWLPRIYKMVQEYSVSSKEFADAIQEGNLGVFLALNGMLGSGKKADYNLVLEKAAKAAIEEYLQGAAAAEDMDQSLLAKAALVYEAQNYLAQEMQRLPAIEELSQYTRLPVEELEDILALSKEN